MNEQDGIERSGQSDQLREIGFSMSVFSLTCFDLDHDPVSFIYPDFCSNFHLSVCCVLHFFFSFLFFSKERCLIDNDLAINFMFVSLAVHFGLCFFCLITFSQAIGDLIRFITLHLQPILPIYIPFFYSFSLVFMFHQYSPDWLSVFFFSNQFHLLRLRT